jgi:hypothetical protein
MAGRPDDTTPLTTTGKPLIPLLASPSSCTDQYQHVLSDIRVIIRLGPPSNILTGFDIDTANFTGNEGPAADVWGLKLEGDEKEVERQEKGLLGDDPRVSWRCFRSLCIGNNSKG